MARVVEIAWPAQGSGGYTVVHDTMVPGEIVAYHFHTPDSLGPKKGGITLTEYNGQPCGRTGCLSLVEGAIDDPVDGETAAFADDMAPSTTFYGSKEKKNAIVLQPNTDYYYNVELANPPATGTFGTQVTFTKPRS